MASTTVRACRVSDDDGLPARGGATVSRRAHNAVVGGLDGIQRRSDLKAIMRRQVIVAVGEFVRGREVEGSVGFQFVEASQPTIRQLRSLQIGQCTRNRFQVFCVARPLVKLQLDIGPVHDGFPGVRIGLWTYREGFRITQREPSCA